MAYLMHFNPNHDPKSGRFDFSQKHPVTDKYTAEYANSIPRHIVGPNPGWKSSENRERIYANQNIALQMVKDFRAARNEHGIGKNAKEYYKLEKKISDEAFRRADFEKKMAELTGKAEEWIGDKYWDEAFLNFDRIFDELGIDHNEGAISNLIDLGYSREDAKAVNDFIRSTGYSINFEKPNKKQ